MTRNGTPLLVGGLISAALGAVFIVALSEQMVGPLKLPALGWILVVLGVVLALLSFVVGRPRSANLREQVSRSADGRSEVREVENDVV